MRKEGSNKKLLVGFIFLLWFLPIIQDLYPITKLKKLEGAVTYAPNESFSSQKWFTGAFTTKKESYLNDQFGLRNFFVRVRNSIYLSLFKTATAKDVIIGKDNYLYEEKYILAYTGKDFAGEKRLKENLKKLEFVSDTLKKLNIDLILLLAPDKASYFPDHIPARYFKGADTMSTNYKWTTKILKDYRLNYIDYNALFHSLKNSTRYPLFPKTGTHWSYYGCQFAFDSLVRYIENIKQKSLTHFKMDNVEWSYEMRDQDEDIAKGLNILSPIKPFKMAYPVLEYYDTLHKFKPRTLIISDSFWSGIYYSGLPKHVFSDPQFWYFYSANLDYGPSGVDPLNYDLQKRLEKNDVVLLMVTTPHIQDMGWGFIEDAYELYTKGKKSLKERQREICLMRIKRMIKTDAKWMFDIEVSAKKSGISKDSMMMLSAISVFENDHWYSFDNYIESPGVYESIKKNILYTPSWLKSLMEKREYAGASADMIATKEAQKIFKNSTSITLQALNGKYLCDDVSLQNLVLANRDKASTWETFHIVNLPDKKCAIYSFEEKFLSTELTQHTQLTATRIDLGEWETFTMNDEGQGTVSFKASNGKYFSFDPSTSQILANGDKIGDKQKFRIKINKE